MPTQPGSFAAKMPAGEDALIRRIQEIERDLRELRTANPLRTAGVEVAPGSMQIGGSLTVTGPAVFITPLPTAPYVGDPEAPTGTSTPAGTLGDATVRAQGDSTAVGANAQQYLTTGTADTAVGSNTQGSLTTGTYNTAVGSNAQQYLTTGTSDTAVGDEAQARLTIGFYDTAVGTSAQSTLTTGHGNTAVGPNAQGSLRTGSNNTAVGPYAQYAPLGDSANATTTASSQTSVGPQTGQSSATQVDGITTIGYRATAGAANATSIGREARADHAGSIALGYQTLTTQVDQVMIGPRDLEITDTTKGLVLVSPDNTRYRVTVANGGALAGGGGSPPAASETVAGIVELASPAETVTGLDDLQATTPAGVAAAIGAVGAPTAYTPVLTAATTNPTLGTGGSAVGRYIQVGNLVTYWFNVVFGTSGAAAGSGAYAISLPVAAVVIQNTLSTGGVIIRAAGLSTQGHSTLRDADTLRLLYWTAAVNGALVAVAHNLPGAFTNNDSLRGYITYEAA